MYECFRCGNTVEEEPEVRKCECDEGIYLSHQEALDTLNNLYLEGVVFHPEVELDYLTELSLLASEEEE